MHKKNVNQGLKHKCNDNTVSTFKNQMFKTVLGVAVFTGLMTSSAFADVLVILPESGSMASAAESIKRGLVQANQNAGSPYQFVFANDAKQSISDILKTQVNAKTQFIIGPLDKKHVNEVLQLKTKLKIKTPILTLNQVEQNKANIYQFALSKQEDALALTRQIKANGISELTVLREKDNPQVASFYEEMLAIWGSNLDEKAKIPLHVTLVNKIPVLKNMKQGVLLLGSQTWLSQQKLPDRNIFTLAQAIEDNKRPPEGIVFCDTAAIYTKKWKDVINAYKQKPVSLPYQRLIAFGGDAWQIMHAILTDKNNSISTSFQGRTGYINISHKTHEIQRIPQCFEYHQKGIKILPRN